jgi:outer membrane protein TolC
MSRPYCPIDIARWLLPCAMALLGGCARFHDRPLDAAASARTLQARSLQDPRLLAFVRLDLHRPAGPLRWDLPALTSAAVYERPDMTIAADTVRAAQAGETTAAALPNPTLGLAPTYNSTLTTPSPWQIGPVVSELLSTAGKRPIAVAEARDATAAARQQLRIAAWQLRGQVRSALIALWAARRRSRLEQTYLAAARRLTAVVAQRLQAGMVSSAALTTQRLTETQAALDMAAVERQERLAEAGLAAAVGVPEAAIQQATIDFAALDRITPPGDLAGFRQPALAARPEVLAALARYAAAQAALRLAIAGQYPDLTIGPGYHYDQGQNKFILAVSLPLPVFNQNQGPIAAARARRRLAAARFQQVQTQVLGQIGTAVADWEASRREAASTRQLLVLARQAVGADATAFRTGAIGRLRLTGSELARAQTELGALNARVHERTALGRLEDALHHRFLDPAGE